MNTTEKPAKTGAGLIALKNAWRIWAGRSERSWTKLETEPPTHSRAPLRRFETPDAVVLKRSTRSRETQPANWIPALHMFAVMMWDACSPT